MRFLGALRGAKNKAVRSWSIAVASRKKLSGTTLIVLGDSFTEGPEAFPQKLAESIGWAVRYVDGQGGTGYVAGAMTYPERIKNLAAVRSDVMLISGGYNDTWSVVTGTKTLSEVQAAVDATLDSAAPLADQVIIIGPFWSRLEPTPPEAYAVNDYVHGAALARGYYFIDVLARNWITPENRKGLISEDETHPSQSGQAFIAERIAAVLLSRQVQ